MRLLFIDSNNSLEEVLRDVSESYVVDRAYSDEEGIYMSNINEYDAVVIDYASSIGESIKICKDLRESETTVPLLVLSDPAELEAKVSLLDAGADVCLSKPVHPHLLHASLRALFRRTFSVEATNIVDVRGIKVNLLNKEVVIGGNIIDLRRKEYELLEYLILNRGNVLSKEQILEHVWDMGLEVFSNTVEVHIKHLRDKIEKPYNICLIKTIRGFGYKIEK